MHEYLHTSYCPHISDNRFYGSSRIQGSCSCQIKGRTAARASLGRHICTSLKILPVLGVLSAAVSVYYSSWSDLIQLFISQTQFVLMGLPWSHTEFCQTKNGKGPTVHMATAEPGGCYMTPAGIIWVQHQSLKELLLTKVEFKGDIDNFKILYSVFCLAE